MSEQSAVYQDLSIVSDELKEAIQPFIDKANARGVEFICIAKLMGDKTSSGYTIHSQISNPDIVLSVASALVDDEYAEKLKIKSIAVETTDGRVIPVSGTTSLIIDPEADVEIAKPSTQKAETH